MDQQRAVIVFNFVTLKYTAQSKFLQYSKVVVVVLLCKTRTYGIIHPPKIAKKISSTTEKGDLMVIGTTKGIGMGLGLGMELGQRWGWGCRKTLIDHGHRSGHVSGHWAVH